MADSPGLLRCVSVIDNNETGRSLMARSNHRIYKKELQEDYVPKGETIPLITKGSFVAMKQYCGNSSKKQMKDLCQKEFELLSKCDHRNVVTVLSQMLEVDEANPESWPVIFMELGECSLYFVINATRKNTNEFTYPTGDGGGYSWRHCLSWLRQVASAMEYLHSIDIVHRDLKSSNVLLFDGKTLCKVCDFDMSRYFNPEGMTLDIGTWRWMAPEVRSRSTNDGKQRYSHKVDCYSFGILMCELIYRQRPFNNYEDRLLQKLETPDTLEFDAEQPGAMTFKKSANDCTLSVKLNREISVFPLSDSLWKLIDNLLSWKQEERYDAKLIKSKLDIESPKPSLSVHSEDTPDAADLPRLMESEAEADSEEPTPTDTGLPRNFVCPQIPSIRRAEKVFYTISFPDNEPTTEEERKRIAEVLKTHEEDVVTFLHDDELSEQEVVDESTNRDENPDGIQCHFQFESGQLQLEIIGTHLESIRRLADCCQRPKFLKWIADFFQRGTRCQRLRKVKFGV